MEYNLDFQKIRKKTQVDDIQSLEFYLNNIFNDLNSREDNSREEKSIERITFIEYMNIPFIVGEKLFKITESTQTSIKHSKIMYIGVVCL